MSAILRGLNSKKTPKIVNLPESYVVSKFFELGPHPVQNAYNNTYQCCCPLCREGKSFGKKRRCFYIPEQELIYCHNCGWSGKPLKWIMEVSGASFHDVVREIEENDHDCININLKDDEPLDIKVPSLPEDCINLCDKSQVNYYKSNKIVVDALKYLNSRNLLTAVNRPASWFLSLKDKTHKNRIIIPFFDINNKIEFYQSRKIFTWDENPSYLSKFNADKTLFNINNVDSEHGDTIYIFEGPIDSCFVKNGIAVGGINEGFGSFNKKQSDQLSNFKFFQKIWVLDNQWIDNTAREKTIALLEQGERVFIWPEKLKNFKDFNDICVKRGLNEVKHSFIQKYSYFGKTAIPRFKVLLSLVG